MCSSSEKACSAALGVTRGGGHQGVRADMEYHLRHGTNEASQRDTRVIIEDQRIWYTKLTRATWPGGISRQWANAHVWLGSRGGETTFRMATQWLIRVHEVINACRLKKAVWSGEVA
jgi:hypothetical protein